MFQIELVTLTVSMESTHSSSMVLSMTYLSARFGQSASEAGCLTIGSPSHLIQSLSLFFPLSLILLI